MREVCAFNVRWGGGIGKSQGREDWNKNSSKCTLVEEQRWKALMIYFILRQGFSHLEAFPLQWHFTVLKEVSACRRALNIWIHCTGLSGCSCSQTLVATVWTFIIVMSCRGSSEPPLKRESPVDDACHILSLIITHTQTQKYIQYIYVCNTHTHTHKQSLVPCHPLTLTLLSLSENHWISWNQS